MLAWTEEFHISKQRSLFAAVVQKIFSSHYPKKCVSQNLERFFFYLEHGIVHKVVVLLMRLLCCQKVCLLTQKQSFATIISDGSGAQTQILCKQMFGKLKQIKSFIIIGKSLLTSPKPVNQVSGNQNHL